MKHKQFIALQILVFSLFSFDSNNEINFSFLRCRHADFVTTPCCFQAPRILCWGTGPPSSRLLVQVYFCGFFYFSDRPTQNLKTHSTINEKKKGWPYSYFGSYRAVGIWFFQKCFRQLALQILVENCLKNIMNEGLIVTTMELANFRSLQGTPSSPMAFFALRRLTTVLREYMSPTFNSFVKC